MNTSRLCILTLLLFLSGCAGKHLNTIPQNNWQQRQQQINELIDWTVEGRISVKTADQGFTANLNWQRLGDNHQLSIFGSFGQTYAEINQTADKATLKLSEDEIYQSTDIETLVQKVLGYPLPLKHLEYWIKGLPYPGNNSSLSFNKLGYLETINYQQWVISYKKYQSYNAFNDLYLPSNITLTNGDVKLRLSLRNWHL